jgi:hypothetical protein
VLGVERKTRRPRNGPATKEDGMDNYLIVGGKRIWIGR